MSTTETTDGSADVEADVEPAVAHRTLQAVTGAEASAHDHTEGERYDVIVLGAGSTGTNVAWYVRDQGLSVAVVEADLVGGECSYWACMPSKALLAPGHAVDAVDGLDSATATLDVSAVLSRRDELIANLDDESQTSWLESTGATLIRGRGRLAGAKTVDVETRDGGPRRLVADRAVVLATGSRPAVPPIEGLDAVDYWTNREATTSSVVPRRLGIIGGGVVGCELGQAFNRLGSGVAIIEHGDRLLTGFDASHARFVTDAMARRGVHVVTETSVAAVHQKGDEIVMRCSDDATLTVDRLLVAVGRTPNSDDAGLQTVGLDDGGYVKVDDHLRVLGVDGDWLYAAGDVNGRALLTHQGKYQARCVADTIGGTPTPAWADSRAVPQVVFTDPELAAVGVSPADAAEDPSLDVIGVDLDSVAATALSTRGAGRATIVVDTSRDDVIVGATFVGRDVAELLHAATVAIIGDVPLSRLWHAVPAFPTMSELWLRLLEAHRGL